MKFFMCNRSGVLMRLHSEWRESVLRSDLFSPFPSDLRNRRGTHGYVRHMSSCDPLLWIVDSR